MQIELLIELECSVIVLPVLAKEFQEPLSGQLIRAIFIFFLITRLRVLVMGKGDVGG